MTKRETKKSIGKGLLQRAALTKIMQRQKVGKIYNNNNNRKLKKKKHLANRNQNQSLAPNYSQHSNQLDIPTKLPFPMTTLTNLQSMLNK